MTVGRFELGSMIWIRGRAAKLVDTTDLGDATVEFSPEGERQQVNLLALYHESAIRWEPPKGAAAPTEKHLEQFSEAEWAEARRREEIIKPLLEGGDVERRITELAQQTKRGKRTLYRWKTDYETAGLRGLVPAYKARGGVGQTRLDTRREAALQDAIKRVYLQRTRPTMRHAYEQVVAEFVAHAMDPPGFHTVRARIHALDAIARTTARDGGRKALARHAVSKGQFPQQERPLQTILIDHTPLDLMLVDSTDRARVIGRPFLTLALDSLTRMVFGYYLALDPPSYLSVAMCILQGVLPKDDALRRFDLKQPWPICGLPEHIHTDNGKDFRSQDLERFAAQYRIELLYRPVRQPQYGGQIERVIGTVNRFTHALPGTSKGSIAERGDYKPGEQATLTLEEAEEFLARRIVEKYHLEVHGSLGKSPLQAWRDATGAGRFVPTLPPDPERFRIDVLPYEERTIQKDGIALFGLAYSDGVLQAWRGTEARGAPAAKYTIKYDPRDLSRVWLIPPEGGAPAPIPLANRTVGAFSMLELRRTQELAKAERQKLSTSNLAEMLLRERKALDEAAERTKDAKRAQRVAARVEQSRRAVGAAEPARAATSSTRPTAPPDVGDAASAPPRDEDDVFANLDDAEGWGTPILNWERA